MNNCIAHSDYTIGGRIYLNEFDDKMILTNPGTFLPGSIEVALQRNYNLPFYHNKLLAETMVKFNMIDTQAMGIRKVFRIQQEKYFPLPDYDLSTPNKVEDIVYGKVIDEKAQYIKNKAFDAEAYRKWIISYLETYEKAKKQDFVKLLKEKLPDLLTDK